MMVPLFAYWDIRGVGQAVRLLLEYTGTHYDEKRYKLGLAPDYDQSCWLNVRFKLGLDFPDLPYYIDGDIKITHSNAILRHLGRKHGLCGHTEEERVRSDILENQATDVLNALIRCSSTHNTEEYLRGFSTTIRLFSDFLGNRTWFAGDHITYVDFLMYEVLDQHLQLDETCLKEAQNLQDFHTRFEELPPIRRYRASHKFLSSTTVTSTPKFCSK